LIPNSKILLCIRNVLDFIISLYKNHVSFGYTENIKYFIQEILALKDYGLLDDLNLKNIIDLTSYYFRDHRIYIYNIDKKPNFSNLLDELNIKPNIDINLNYNKSPLLHETEIMRSFNKSVQNRKNLLGWLESHRIFYKSNLSQNQIFEMSRHRILQNNYLREQAVFDLNNQNIEWPVEILNLEINNSLILNSEKFPENFKLLI